MDIPTNWTFKNKSVAENFDKHVREQLPWYELATGAATHIARHYIPDNGLVYDIGASTGNMGRALADTLEVRKAKFIAIEPSPEMCEKYFGPDELVMADALDYDFEEYDVCICFLVLMFIPPEKRRTFLKKLSSKIKQGGALIVFDKTETHGGYISTVLHRLTIAGKVATGVSSEEIINKELSLSGVQRPLPSKFIEFTCANATEIFRFGEFAGWVIERPE